MSAEECRYELKKIPPESGWGYMVAIGMALPFVSSVKLKSQKI